MLLLKILSDIENGEINFYFNVPQLYTSNEGSFFLRKILKKKKRAVSL